MKEGIESVSNSDEQRAFSNYFESQWRQAEQVEGPSGERFAVHDIAPPEDVERQGRPLILGLGWGSVPESHRQNIGELVRQGRRVIAADTPQGIATEQVEGFPTIQLRKMAALETALRERGIGIEHAEGEGVSQADIVAHSEGAIFSVLLAYFHPELVKNLVLINPAGMTGKINPATFLSRWIRDMKQGIRNEYTEPDPEHPSDITKGEVTLGDVLKKDLLHSAASVLAMTVTDMRDMLVAVREKGVRIVVIHTTDDEQFPMDRMAGRLEHETGPDGEDVLMKIPELTAEHVDGFYSIRGKHTSYFEDPEKYAYLTTHALDVLDAKDEQERSQTDR